MSGTPGVGIAGKVVALTGTSSIGEATGRYLALRGARIVLGARGRERLEMLASEMFNTLAAARVAIG